MTKFNRYIFAAFAGLLHFGVNASAPTSMEAFLGKLMAKMTLEEKVGQLVQYTADMSHTGSSVRDNYKEDILRGGVGSIFNAYTPQFTRELQQLAVERTRLKIPLLFGYDVIHGHRTIFPIPLAESSSWDLKLIEKSARIAAVEAAADGIHWTFAPMADVSRDPRWGRVSEGAGEDPWLGAKIAAVRVKGFQGKDLASEGSVLACVKHFAAYGAPIGGRDYNTVDMSERELFETYLPPYEAAVKAGAATVMTSFNEIAGIPSTSNQWLLTELLRRRWGFKGFVVTDYTAINELQPHGVAEDEAQAGLLAMRAGVDMDMQGAVYARFLAEQVRRGLITEKALNSAVRRVLEAKYKLGLFADPYARSNEARAREVLMAKPHLEHARDIARRSIVLLKNDGVLPLKRAGVIAVIGALAGSRTDMIGSWSAAGDGNQAASLLDGIGQVVGGRAQVLFADGRDENEARRIAASADVIILGLGETRDMSGEAASRTKIRLPEAQAKLLKAVSKAGKPVVLIVFSGRPLVLEEETSLANALIAGWFLGTQAGNALADVLFGDYNPSGKLTMTFPRSEGQIPIFYSTKNTGRPFAAGNKYTSKYLDSPNEPLFPFGWGLSYTTFALSAPRLSSATLLPGKTLKVFVTVSNTGRRAGEETVQLYIRDMVASVTRPVKQLRGFTKVFLRPGEHREVVMELGIEDLKFYNQKMQWIAEPGTFKVMVGGNSVDVNEAEFRLLD